MKTFELLQAEHAALVEAASPSMLYIASMDIPPPLSPYSRSMMVWNEVAGRVKVDLMSIRPSPLGEHHFEAEPRGVH